MKEAALMAGGSFAGWLVASIVTGGEFRAEMLLGMLGPLAVACVTWVMAERVYVRNPRALTGLMISAFAFKLVFFGGYVAVMLRVLRVRPAPFAVSFSSFFIALHFVEAWLLSRLFAGPRG